jgi:hypothetical protein
MVYDRSNHRDPKVVYPFYVPFSVNQAIKCVFRLLELKLFSIFGCYEFFQPTKT